MGIKLENEMSLGGKWRVIREGKSRKIEEENENVRN